MIIRAADRPEHTATAVRGGHGEAFSRYLTRGENRSPLGPLAINRLPPGASWGPKSHPNTEEIFIILTGTAEVLDGENRHTLTPHDTLQAPPNHQLAIRNPGPEDLTFLALLINHPKKSIFG